jgi:hypothetical protein
MKTLRLAEGVVPFGLKDILALFKCHPVIGLL